MSNRFDSHLLVTFAMREEAQGLFEAEGASVLYTGLGKVNAAYALMRELKSRAARGEKTSLVVNFGTAGSPVFATHEAVEITRFVQRDMDVSALGFAPGVTPFEEGPAHIEVVKRLVRLPSGTCGTGDSFETGRPRVECDVVDMEAFALAKVCREEDLPFLSVKYITDGSDHNAHNDWAANLPRAAARFLELYRELRGGMLGL
jgi:adenosylhomocysteine nucleosidase